MNYLNISFTRLESIEQEMESGDLMPFVALVLFDNKDRFYDVFGAN